MKVRSIRLPLILIASILLLMSIPPRIADWMRGGVMRSVQMFRSQKVDDRAELQRYILENQLLKSELKLVASRLGDQAATLTDSQWRAIPSRVIFRSPGSWDNSLWVNVGQNVNRVLGREMIAKNSPVVQGNAIVGLVDYVGEKQSRIRLITDSTLTPSVRVVRTVGTNTYYLAKGELHGEARPLWRKNQPLLRGVGFNYDFADEHGPARELRSGRPLNDVKNYPTLPLVKVGDLLVTTGLDGVFPPDLRVATVTKIVSLKEGDYYYELEATPLVDLYDDLSLVFILPSLGFDPMAADIK